MTTNEHPMPASPLPWALCGASYSNCTCVMVWAADGETLVHMGSVLKDNADQVERHEGMVKNAAYIEWACNNAPSLAAEVARLKAALAYYADDANYDVVTRHYPASYDSEGYVMQEAAGSYEAIPVNEDGGAIARAALEAK